MKKVKVATLMLLVSVSIIAILCTNVEYSSATFKKFGSYDELKEFVKNARPQSYYLYGRSSSFTFGALNALEAEEYSETNIQVEGVDEADIVKTDGEFIYVISGQRVVIVKAYPAEEAAVLSRITVDGALNQIFINQQRLVVFYENSSDGETKTFIKIYDVSDKENPSFKREITVEGCYFSSRMIDDYVYVITVKGAWLINDEVSTPRICYEDQIKTVLATDIYYSDIVDYGYMYTTIVAVNVQEDGQEPNDETVLSGYATDIYVSMENIYLAMVSGDKTVLHRIHIENGEISYASDGEIHGTVLNQFSMDEHESYFRIATTSQITAVSQNSFALMPSQNNIYILDMDLETVGKIESIASGEKIYSARFMGDMFYLVTFRKVDPLFVIDLSDPYNPKILGELEITGYSDYLHPYDENHMIGIGKETIAAHEGDFSWYQGVKISLFDVTDMSKPEELAKFEIGDRGTDSPVLRDHKAFLFDKEKNLLIIPVTVAKIDESQYPNGVPPYAYGEIVWQGAYVFTVSLELEEEILLKGTITHVENGNVHDTSHYITRTLYIGEILYTISESKIKMNSLADLSKINELNLSE